jgi:3-hydroxybutyryl-CoA dehydrogenase
MSEISRIGVVGGGLMGAGIAEVCARAGFEVIVNEVDAEAVNRARDRIAGSMDRAVERGKLDEAVRDAAMSLLTFTSDLDQMADRDLVIEAVAEEETAKTQLFARLDKIVTSENAIFASNTSSIPIMKLGVSTSRPEQVLGLHFFNPVPVLPLVEVVTSLLTGDDTVRRAEDLAINSLGKTVIRARDRAGFIVNALLVPYILSAIRMVESGFASPDDIDNGMVLGCAHPMGPLRLADLIGLDTTKAIADSLYEEFREQLYSPPPLLLRMVDAGLLGRKTEQGFYHYR